MMSVVVDGEEDFVALDEDEPGFAPIPFRARDVAEIRPQWNSIARALAPLVGFDDGAWETDGQVRRLAVDGQWRNPSLASPDYYRVSKAFLRLRQLLQALVPLPGDPFKKRRGAFVPAFQIRLHPDLRAGMAGYAGNTPRNPNAKIR